MRINLSYRKEEIGQNSSLFFGKEEIDQNSEPVNESLMMGFM